MDARAALEAGDLRGVVRALDVAWEEPTSEAAAVLAAAFAAVGPAVRTSWPDPRLERTIEAALDMATVPVAGREDAWTRLFDAGTDSYPFGPGDGCHSIDGPEVPHAAPGTGCRSGAGSLMSVAAMIGDEAVLAAIGPVVLAWSRREQDARVRLEGTGAARALPAVRARFGWPKLGTCQDESVTLVRERVIYTFDHDFASQYDQTERHEGRWDDATGRVEWG
jgi:hypothetical protein